MHVTRSPIIDIVNSILRYIFTALAQLENFDLSKNTCIKTIHVKGLSPSHRSFQNVFSILARIKSPLCVGIILDMPSPWFGSRTFGNYRKLDFEILFAEFTSALDNMLTRPTLQFWGVDSMIENVIRKGLPELDKQGRLVITSTSSSAFTF